ncbi:hypothetical protein SASPL_155947 [Salvia splendens]|uniref:Uncharacterized protein n=1 Tax=Salvia splendens TaxID=180675 RepID=A0A8X8YWS7_SALSN|nr:hypothetical protein SASPL_155947 [Salvia splendens]
MAVTSTAGMVAGCGGGGILVRCPGCICSRSLPCLASSRIPGPNLSIYHTQFPLKTHLKLYRSPKLARAADSTQSSSIATANTDKTVIPDSEFTLAKVAVSSLPFYSFVLLNWSVFYFALICYCYKRVSFGVVGLGLGVGLLSYGFGAYFNILPGSEWSALMLTYGFPLAIIGMALKYAELKPVPCLTYSDALAMREKCSTPILNQVVFTYNFFFIIYTNLVLCMIMFPFMMLTSLLISTFAYVITFITEPCALCLPSSLMCFLVVC